MDFDNETIKFNMFEMMMRYPVDTETCFTMSTTGSIAQKYFELMKDDVLETVISQGIGVNQEGNSQAFEEISITHIDEILEQSNILQGAEITGERKFVLVKSSCLQLFKHHNWILSHCLPISSMFFLEKTRHYRS